MCVKKAAIAGVPLSSTTKRRATREIERKEWAQLLRCQDLDGPGDAVSLHSFKNVTSGVLTEIASFPVMKRIVLNSAGEPAASCKAASLSNAVTLVSEAVPSRTCIVA